MSQHHSDLLYLSFSEIQSARIDGRQISLASVIFEAVKVERLRSVKEPRLDDIKWLLVELLRFQRQILLPILSDPVPRGSVQRLSGGDRAGWHHDWPSDMPEDNAVNRQTAGRPMEILMVEDSLTFARITMTALRKANIDHRFTWLTDGESALEFLFREGRFIRAPQPDLILLDLGLPKIDGREVLAEIKLDDVLRTIPVVVMTVSTSYEDRIESERLDVEAFLTKPVDLIKFQELVRDLKNYWHEDMIVPAVC